MSGKSSRFAHNPAYDGSQDWTTQSIQEAAGLIEPAALNMCWVLASFIRRDAV